MKKLLQFLISRSEGYDNLSFLRGSKELLDLIEEKRQFVVFILIDYMRRFGAILHSMETGDSYKKQPTDETLMKQFDYLRKIQEAYVSNEEYQIKTFESFLSPNFKPSDNFYGLIKDLISLQMYYGCLAYAMPCWMTSGIDLVTLRVPTNALRAIQLFDHKGRHSDLYRKGIEKIRTKKLQAMQHACEEFYRIDPAEMAGKSTNWIAKNIQKNLRKKGIYPEGKDRTKSITRYLKEDAKIKRYLI